MGQAVTAMAEQAAAPMHIIYASTLMHPDTFRRVFADAPFPPSQAAQKYHRLMTEGLAANDAQVTALSAPPVSRLTGKQRIVCVQGETQGGVRYRYLPIIDLPVVKHAVVWLWAFFTVLFSANRNTYVLCDALNITLASAARTAARLRNRPCAAIVTDVPDILGGNSLAARANMRQILRYDGYVLLTAAMNKRVNPRHKPFLVAEGQADASLLTNADSAEKYPDPVCLYAGMLHEKYGILRLVQAFLLLPHANARLIIYGTGDAAERIQKIANADARIEYRGVCDNAEVVREEARAWLLINPRPSDEEFTRFSFPSKNLEYMASGTAVLTTKLPGMPAAYHDYVYLFDDETPAGMADTLVRLLSSDRAALDRKGAAARNFVLTEKSNVTQAKRILALLHGLGRKHG